MTIQVTSAIFGKSKAALQDALNTIPTAVVFADPSIFAGSRGHFTGSDMSVGEVFPVVMDPARRSRFALVKRVRQDTFKVS
jgi:hypothetical protein